MKVLVWLTVMLMILEGKLQAYLFPYYPIGQYRAHVSLFVYSNEDSIEQLEMQKVLSLFNTFG